MAFYQGKFKPHNPKKYIGNTNDIIYRSSWEWKYMMKLDHDPNVLKWSSEEFFIPYRSPIDGKTHRYFPDFLICRKTPQGEVTELIEIKPAQQTKAPSQGKKRRITFINEVYRFGVNDAKWKAAKIYCENKGWKFRILTEKDLNVF